jgi:hypothetical protein
MSGQEKMLGSRFNLGNITSNFYAYLTKLVQTPEGKIQALGILCSVVVISILLIQNLKNHLYHLLSSLLRLSIQILNRALFVGNQSIA